MSQFLQVKQEVRVAHVNTRCEQPEEARQEKQSNRTGTEVCGIYLYSCSTRYTSQNLYISGHTISYIWFSYLWLKLQRLIQLTCKQKSEFSTRVLEFQDLNSSPLPGEIFRCVKVSNVPQSLNVSSEVQSGVDVAFPLPGPAPFP